MPDFLAGRGRLFPELGSALHMGKTFRRSLPFMAFLTGLSMSAGFMGLPRFAALRTLAFRDNFQSGKLDAWLFPHPEDWEIRNQGKRYYLHMKRSREPGVPRRPLQFALLKRPPVEEFELQARVRREGHSMLVVFDYVDTLHFYYAHLSVDPGSKVDVHNGLFIVNNEARKRIAGLEAAPALPDQAWHQLRLVRDAASGSIEVFMDGRKEPLFATHDKTFTCGRIGLGSFDETGDFADVDLQGQGGGCEPSAGARPAKTN